MPASAATAALPMLVRRPERAWVGLIVLVLAAAFSLVLLIMFAGPRLLPEAAANHSARAVQPSRSACSSSGTANLRLAPVRVLKSATVSDGCAANQPTPTE